MSLPDEMVPKTRERIMDLVDNAGVSIEDWSKCKTSNKAASNPKYCYNWSFINEEAKILAVTIWYDDIVEEGFCISCNTNDLTQMMQIDMKYGLPYKVKQRILETKKNLEIAFQNNYSVRIIVVSGEKRVPNGTPTVSSEVKRRILDPVAWRISNYNRETQEYTLQRG